MLTNTTPDAPTNITHVQAAEGTIMKSHATGDIVFKGMPNVTFKAQVFEDFCLESEPSSIKLMSRLFCPQMASSLSIEAATLYWPDRDVSKQDFGTSI